ncbi:MAG: rhodanese-like domain-containing protein, partial [Prolixibacteraceae bacterium]|nr:rhodanese-like domain-containing protein [Prolixibacteraceae bacterium]
QQKCVFREIAADKLAYEIVNNHYQLNVIDVRSPEEYEEFHIPLAINIPFDEILDRKWEQVFKQKEKTNIFYADSDTLVRMSCLKAKFIGKSTNFILREGVSEFREMYYNPAEPVAGATKQEINTYNFRMKATHDMENLKDALKNIGKPVTKEIKIAQGGCS